MKKLVVWDCDDTLWHGTIMYGDDLVLKHGVKEILETLHNRGVVQSIASTNIKDDVLQKLEQFGISSYFLVPHADLETPKSGMVKSIKDILGIARFKDIVFVDDQVFNRCEVEDSCEGVYSCQSEDMLGVIEKFFTKDHYTAEDRKRVQRYRAELERVRGAESYGGDYISFLRSCHMSVEFFTPEEIDMKRFNDLIVRANRMSAMDSSVDHAMVMEKFSEDSKNLVACRVSDKYGSYGLCALAILDAKEVVNIQGIVVSCRLQGKGIGSALLGSIIQMATGKAIKAEWAVTKYNAGMKNLYDWYNFLIEEGDGVAMASFGKFEDHDVSLPPWLQITNRCKQL